MRELTPLVIVPVLLLAGHAFAEESIKIAQPAWIGLAPEEQSALQKKFVIEIAESESFGVIIDNQGLDKSIPGSTAGSSLGSAVADASYIDRALRSGNYSAKNELGVAILGAIIGSAFDRRPVAQFHFRYAVKLGTGDIKYFDEVKGDAFRHPIGVCVSVPFIALIDQQICSQTAADVKARYLGIPTAPLGLTESANGPSASENSRSEDGASRVNCRLGALAPVRTTAEKCRLIGGVETL